jgi:hypothetical protein
MVAEGEIELAPGGKVQVVAHQIDRLRIMQRLSRIRSDAPSMRQAKKVFTIKWLFLNW